MNTEKQPPNFQLSWKNQIRLSEDRTEYLATVDYENSPLVVGRLPAGSSKEAFLQFQEGCWFSLVTMTTGIDLSRVTYLKPYEPHQVVPQETSKSDTDEVC